MSIKTMVQRVVDTLHKVPTRILAIVVMACTIALFGGTSLVYKTKSAAPHTSPLTGVVVQETGQNGLPANDATAISKTVGDTAVYGSVAKQPQVMAEVIEEKVLSVQEYQKNILKTAHTRCTEQVTESLSSVSISDIDALPVLQAQVPLALNKNAAMAATELMSNDEDLVTLYHDKYEKYPISLVLNCDKIVANTLDPNAASR